MSSQTETDNDTQSLLKEARKCLKKAQDAERENRELAVEDLKFLNSDQWDESLKQQRKVEGRPCLTINRLPAFIDQVVGDQRLNRPRIKVRPADPQGDNELASIIEGLVRTIEYTSRADSVYDYTFEQAVSAGFGYFRIDIDYTSEDSFDRELRIRRIVNPFAVYFDPSAKEMDLSDARWCILTDVISREEFKKRFSDAQPLDFEGAGKGEEFQGWFEKDKVRIAEYWVKEKSKKKVVLLSDGRTMDKKEADLSTKSDTSLSIIEERDSEKYEVKQYLISGNEILDGPTEWKGKYIPIIPVLGKELNIQGKKVLRGLIRHAKDSQRMYNFWRTAAAELVALTPKAPYLLTPEQLEGFEEQWRQANIKTYPYLLYNKTDGSVPQRTSPATVPQGVFTEAQVSVDDMKATTNVHDASLGLQGNETSGKAIMARQREGDVGNFAFIDNLCRAISYAGRILVDLIPKIYDTERIIRIRKEDDSEEAVPINKQITDRHFNPVVINDITQGQYDVMVDTGPNYTTQRMEAVEGMLEFARILPDNAHLFADLIAKNMDWPGASEIFERLQILLPPQMRKQDEEKPPVPTLPPPPKVQIEMAKIQSKEKIELLKLELEKMIAQAKLGLDTKELELKIIDAMRELMGPAPENPAMMLSRKMV
ncbi:MAG: hypothetical protein KGJ01_02950 [Patescibacteria group bacterium]|nr:hypothetical protein [Patescibacteria group bacterium]